MNYCAVKKTDIANGSGLEYRGSANQRIIDLRRTADRGEIVLWRETNE